MDDIQKSIDDNFNAQRATIEKNVDDMSLADENNIIEKAKKSPIGTTHTNKYGVWKKVSDTGNSKVDWQRQKGQKGSTGEAATEKKELAEMEANAASAKIANEMAAKENLKKYGPREEPKDDLPAIGSKVKLNADVNLISLSGLKGQSLEVVGTEKGTVSQPVFLKVKDKDGDIHSINPEYVSVEKEAPKEGSFERGDTVIVGKYEMTVVGYDDKGNLKVRNAQNEAFTLSAAQTEKAEKKADPKEEKTLFGSKLVDDIFSKVKNNADNVYSYTDAAGSTFHAKPGENKHVFAARIAPDVKMEGKKEPEEKKEASLKDKYLSKSREEYVGAKSEIAMRAKKVAEYKEKGYSYGKEPWKKKFVNDEWRRLESARKRLDKAIFGHTVLKSIFKELGVSQSTYHGTAIKGFSIPSAGYEFKDYDKSVIEFNGMTSRFDSVVEKIKNSGFEVVSESKPSKAIYGASIANIKIKPLYSVAELEA